MSNSGAMPTNADRWAVDTSVAVAALDSSHTAHKSCVEIVRRLSPGLAGHAAFETYSVLTRMPGPLTISGPTATELLRRVFPDVLWLNPKTARGLVAKFGVVGITGGGVYDGLIGAAAHQHVCILLTRDQRAKRTYDLLGYRYQLVGP